MIFLYEKKILTWHTKWNVKCCRLINQLIITKKISSCAILEKQTFFINRDGRMILLNIIAYNNKDFISLNFLKVNSAVFYSSKFSFKNKFYEGHMTQMEVFDMHALLIVHALKIMFQNKIHNMLYIICLARTAQKKDQKNKIYTEICSYFLILKPFFIMY